MLIQFIVCRLKSQHRLQSPKGAAVFIDHQRPENKPIQQNNKRN